MESRTSAGESLQERLQRLAGDSPAQLSGQTAADGGLHRSHWHPQVQYPPPRSFLPSATHSGVPPLGPSYCSASSLGSGANPAIAEGALYQGNALVPPEGPLHTLRGSGGVPTIAVGGQQGQPAQPMSKDDPYASLLTASASSPALGVGGVASHASFQRGTAFSSGGQSFGQNKEESSGQVQGRSLRTSRGESDLLQRLQKLSGSALDGPCTPGEGSAVRQPHGPASVSVSTSPAHSPLPSRHTQRFASAPAESVRSGPQELLGVMSQEERSAEEGLKERLLRLSGSCELESDEDSSDEAGETERDALKSIHERLLRLAGLDAEANEEEGEEEGEEEPESAELREMRLRLLRLKRPPPGHEVEDQEVSESYEDDVDAPMERDEEDLSSSKGDEGVGADTPEQCGMIVRWQEKGKEVVPADPTQNLSPAQAQRFLEQKELVPTDYNVIADDPRFVRLKNKWDPNIFTKKGAKQYVKNKLHPETLPYIGLMFHAHHACDSINAMDRLKKIEKTASNEELRSTFKTMQGAQRTRAMRETAYTGVGAAMLLLPLLDIVPGLGPNLFIVGQVVTEVAEKGISLGLRVLVSEGAHAVGQATTKPQKSFGTYGQTKAFLMYLGAPHNPDPLYAQWEESRMRLKALYGCKPEDDLFKMKPKGRLVEQLRREEEDSKMAYVAEVPLLLLLFRTFHCWDELLYDRLMQKKDSAINISRLTLLNSAQCCLSLEERRRKRDMKKLQNTAALVETQQGAPIDSHLRLLNSTFKKDVVHVLCEAFLHSNRVAFLFNDRKPRSFQRSAIKLFFRMIVDYFYEHNAYVWGYVAEDHRILGVAIWDRPNRTAKISLLSMLSVSSLKLGPTRFRQMTDLITDLEEVRNEDIRGVACWMIHWLGVLPIANRQGIGRLLVENCVERHPEPLYVQLLDPEKEAIEFFTQGCFEELRRSPTRAYLRGSPVAVVSMWLGVDSPDAIRQLPVKSKGRLALTYAVLRKAASNPSLLQLAGSLGSSRSSCKALPLALETAEYVEAKKELAEAEERLECLRLELAQDDDLYSGLDEVVMEQERLVEEQRSRLETLKKSIAQERRLRSGAELSGRSRNSSFSKLGRSRKKLLSSAPAVSLSSGASSPALLQGAAEQRPLHASTSFPGRPLPVPGRALPVPPSSSLGRQHCSLLEPIERPQEDFRQAGTASTGALAGSPASTSEVPQGMEAVAGHRPLPLPPSTGTDRAGSARQLPTPPPTLSELAAQRNATCASQDGGVHLSLLSTSVRAEGPQQLASGVPQAPLTGLSSTLPQRPLPVPGQASTDIPPRPLPIPGQREDSQ